MGLQEVIGGIMVLVIYIIISFVTFQERIKTSINMCKNKRETPEGVVVNGYGTLSRVVQCNIFNI